VICRTTNKFSFFAPDPRFGDRKNCGLPLMLDPCIFEFAVALPLWKMLIQVTNHFLIKSLFHYSIHQINLHTCWIIHPRKSTHIQHHLIHRSPPTRLFIWHNAWRWSNHMLEHMPLKITAIPIFVTVHNIAFRHRQRAHLPCPLPA
jgi:hypothetical protein